MSPFQGLLNSNIGSIQGRCPWLLHFTPLARLRLWAASASEVVDFSQSSLINSAFVNK
jgi:hypothetical protein